MILSHSDCPHDTGIGPGRKGIVCNCAKCCCRGNNLNPLRQNVNKKIYGKGNDDDSRRTRQNDFTRPYFEFVRSLRDLFVVEYGRSDDRTAAAC